MSRRSVRPRTVGGPGARHRSVRPLAAVLTVPAVLAALGAGPGLPSANAATAAVIGATVPDPVNVVYGVQQDGGKIVSTSVTPLGKDAFGTTDVRPKAVKEVAPRTPPRVQPELRDLVAASDPSRPVEVLATFRSSFDLPLFPMPELGEGRGSETNKLRLAQAERLVAEVRAKRAESYAPQLALVEKAGGKVLDTYWLIQGVRAVVPAGSLEVLLQDGDLQYLEIADDLAKPPADANPDNDLEDARQQIASDPYFNLGQTSGWIGLLDTGVRTTHDVFNTPDHISVTTDLTGDGDPTDQCNHGTASAGLITGNDRLGAAWRGVSAITLDSFDIYGNDCLVGSAAVVDGFEEAVSWLDKVIVAEVQLNAAETGAAAAAADAAFDTGSVVVAANGNFGPAASTVRSPGNAHKALGIGAADLQTDALMNYSGRGPTADGRYKPDLVLPTNIETARSSSDTALGSFGGTSAATPVAGGAVALMRNWMRGGVGSIDAGHVYSHAILGGQTVWPFDNNTGAGPFVLGTGGNAWWGKVDVTQGGTVEIPIAVAAGKTRYEGALWWPEGTSTHNDVDLALVSPTGAVLDSSVSGVSVFERARVDGLTAGTWKLRITGFSVTGSQTVYWSARTR